MKKSTAAACGSVFVAGILAIGCANEVIIPGEATSMPASDPSGAGGAGGGDSTGTETVPPKDECETCTKPADSTTCSCSQGCPDASYKIRIECASITDLQGIQKLQCVCSVGDQFSGACFEKNPSELCSFDMGCCAKYFSGK